MLAACHTNKCALIVKYIADRSKGSIKHHDDSPPHFALHQHVSVYLNKHHNVIMSKITFGSC